MSTEYIAFAKLPLMIELSDEFLYPDAMWMPHYNKRDYEGNWTVLPLRSPEGKANAINSELMGSSHYADTAYLDDFPQAKKLMAYMQCPLKSVRLLNLQAGAVIKEHRDHELYVEAGEARLHFPLLTNNDVAFYVNDTRVKMQAGECWYINANLPHRVANQGATDRIHLVMDCVVNDWLTSIFNKAEKTTVKQEQDPELLKKMISSLRTFNTPATNNYADHLEKELKKIIH